MSAGTAGSRQGGGRGDQEPLPVVTAHVDGASRGNPGRAAIGVVLTDEEGRTVREIGGTIGRATNNVAEYTALIRAMAAAHGLGAGALEVLTDSELMARQISGRYRVKNKVLRALYEVARSLAGDFRRFAVTHVGREDNERADELANAALDGDLEG